jgi:hypothetical protein
VCGTVVSNPVVSQLALDRIRLAQWPVYPGNEPETMYRSLPPPARVLTTPCLPIVAISNASRCFRNGPRFVRVPFWMELTIRRDTTPLRGCAGSVPSCCVNARGDISRPPDRVGFVCSARKGRTKAPVEAAETHTRQGRHGCMRGGVKRPAVSYRGEVDEHEVLAPLELVPLGLCHARLHPAD